MKSPVITAGALAVLEGFLQRAHRVFEWGAGDSTHYFGLRCDLFVSVEHCLAWYLKLRAALAQENSSCRLVYQPPEPFAGEKHDSEDVDGYQSDAADWRDFTFKRYCSFIDYFPCCFDVIMVDGRARPSCLKHAAVKLAPGGLLILDNSERPRYQGMCSLFTGWSQTDYPGVLPSGNKFQTTIWIRPKS